MDKKSYELEEMTFISMLLFSERVTKEVYDKAFLYTNENMFYDYRIRKLYNLIKEYYEQDADMLGSDYFAYKLSGILEIEHNIPQTFFLDIKDRWLPIGLIDKFIKQIQDRYFNEEFKLATSEDDFQKILKLKQEYALTDDMVDVYSDTDSFLKEYETRKNTAVFTGYSSIDNVVGSMQGGDMIVLAGGTGGGKTCMMLNLVSNIAKQGKNVDIFSLEMPKSQLQQRMICSAVELDASKFRKFTLTDSDKKKYFNYANNDFKNLNIRIYRNQTVGIDKIKAIEMKSKADIVFIDYLGLINSFANRGTYDRFSEISRCIKLIAMACNKPIVALHQLNRNFQDREDKTPKLSDIRDSGKIEQDADMVWFVHRPGVYEPEKYGEEDLRFIVAKNRHGATNKEVKLKFNGMYQKITQPIRISA